MTIITTAKAESKVKQINRKKLRRYFSVLYPEPFVDTLTSNKNEKRVN